MKGSGLLTVAAQFPGSVSSSVGWGGRGPTSRLEKSQEGSTEGSNFQTPVGQAVFAQAALGSRMILLFSKSEKASGGGQGTVVAYVLFCHRGVTQAPVEAA